MVMHGNQDGALNGFGFRAIVIFQKMSDPHFSPSRKQVQNIYKPDFNRVRVNSCLLLKSPSSGSFRHTFTL